ncbi:hypothetical protein K504DRAFT_45179 [Pleomassaria siparia CBS 279.74]|uniref:Uncharacterized protein n=1 Tax=Pleomassaria siparia CBS 279.74 TaxID=1314801 RepID=A0A6G1K4V2_9PLEO|nr:hypothetical protein K504DRAFT_45179 [Pleomassaria siparia CBS 279.74]
MFGRTILLVLSLALSIAAAPIAVASPGTSNLIVTTNHAEVSCLEVLSSDILLTILLRSRVTKRSIPIQNDLPVSTPPSMVTMASVQWKLFLIIGIRRFEVKGVI